MVPIIIGNIINRVILEKNCKSKKLKKILKRTLISIYYKYKSSTMFFWLGFLPPMIINEVEHDLPPLAIMLFRPL